MLKLQQFYIYKFSSSRLKKSKYDINISLDGARANGELVTINNSELLRTLFRLKGKEFSQEKLDILLKTQKTLRKLNNTRENREKLQKINQEIDNTLFVEDLITIEFKHKSHYLTILKKNGFYVNGIRFTPFMASSGMIRRNTAMFINNNIKYQFTDILENGRNENIPMVPAKFGAYFSLYCSSSLPVSFPKFAIVSDKKIKTMRKVDLVSYKGVDEDDDVIETNYCLESNCWDGQGLITPRLAEQWSAELELDYKFSCAIIRAPFLKGLLVVFDIWKFATEIVGDYSFTDIYGNQQNIYDVDLIISESMFKLWDSYKSTNDYIKKCQENELGFSIAKVNPKKESSYSRTSYQFLQVLNLKETDVAKLCEPTINWFRDISGGNPLNMLLYATGESGFEPKDFSKMDIAVKAILLNPELARDRFIQGRFVRTIEKKKREAYIGHIIVPSNYQFMIGDPYYQACHVFKLENEPPLLGEGQHYSEYWLNQNIKQVAAIRSPIVHHSEFNVLDFQDTEKTRTWFSHIHSGIIIPANGIGIDCAIHGGADFDGDLLCTINNPIMINGRMRAIPIVYESKKAEKSTINSKDDESQVKGQLNGHNSKVGFATNVSSSLYCMLEEFPKESPEHQTILKRLKIGRVIQGEIIDGVKGLTVPPFRNHWVKKKPKNDIPKEEEAKWELYNKILCTTRPAFFRFLYPHYMSRYNKELKRYNIYCMLMFGKTFDEVWNNPKTSDEIKTVENYKKNTYFLNNNSTMNRISRYMRANLHLIGKYSDKSSKAFDYRILLNDVCEISPDKLQMMKKYVDEYKAFKRGQRHNLENAYNNTDSFIAFLRKKCEINISSNSQELACYAVEATYGENDSAVEFPWRMFPQGMIQNIFANKENEKIIFPVHDDSGEIEYLFSRYTLKEYNLEEIYA